MKAGGRKPTLSGGGELPVTFVRLVRDALGHLHDVPYLQVHALAEALPGRSANQGLALQRELESVLEELSAASHGGEKRSRTYRLLKLRYFDALEPPAVWRALGIGKTEYYHQHAYGLRAAASLLRLRWNLLGSGSIPVPEPTSGDRLPHPLTSFVGRQNGLALIRQRVGASRLFSLVGVGGIGKTRMAIEAAHGMITSFPDGMWFVDLVPTIDETGIERALAAALGVRESPTRTLLYSIVVFLRPKRALLLIDNCEHVLNACASIVETLLRNCPDLRLLVTSRARLGAEGEVSWQVPPLITPSAADPLADVESSEAVQLFLERAHSVDLQFEVRPAAIPALIDVCRRLDGMPLAIELAAARMRMLSVRDLAARLDDRFALLTNERRTAVPRHQTLGTLVDWSHELLTELERVVLRRLSVFVGGWTLSAAEAVCGGGSVEPENVLDALTGLVDQSMVVVDRIGDDTRYRLLETIREYAAERLTESGERFATGERHARFYLELAEHAEPELRGPNQLAWFDRLAREHDNLRTALMWWEARESVELGLRLAAALWRFWWFRGHVTEGRGWLQGLLAAAERSPDDIRGGLLPRALHASGVLTLVLDEYTDARALLERAATGWRELGNRRGEADALYWLGAAVFFPGDYGGARAVLTRGADLCRELDDPGGLAETLTWLGWVAITEQALGEARVVLDSAVEAGRKAGDRSALGFALDFLAYAALAQGDSSSARAAFTEARRVLEEVGNYHLLGYAVAGLGAVAGVEGQPAVAERLLTDGLRLLHAVPDVIGVPLVLEMLACSTAVQGDHTRVLRLAGSATAHREALGNHVTLGFESQLAAAVTSARRSLGAETAAHAWAQALQLSQEDAVAYALSARPVGTSGAWPRPFLKEGSTGVLCIE